MTSRANHPRWKRLLLASCDGFNARFAVGAEIHVHPHGRLDPKTCVGRVLAPGAHIQGDAAVVRVDTVRGAVRLKDVHARSWVGALVDAWT